MSVIGQGYAAANIVRQRPTDNSPLRCAKAARLRDHWDLKSRGPPDPGRWLEDGPQNRSELDAYRVGVRFAALHKSLK
jgi:hypothetical protein